MSNLITADYFNDNMTTLGLKASLTPQAEALDVLIADASEWVENYCDRVIAAASVVSVVRGRGYRRLILDQWPVNSLTSIAVEFDSGAPATVDTALVRILGGGVLEFKNPVNGPFRTDAQYTITYNAGYATVPASVKRATALKVADLMNPQFQGPHEREVNMVSEIEEKIIDLLEPYRRERIG